MPKRYMTCSALAAPSPPIHPTICASRSVCISDLQSRIEAVQTLNPPSRAELDTMRRSVACRGRYARERFARKPVVGRPTRIHGLDTLPHRGVPVTQEPMDTRQRQMLRYQPPNQPLVANPPLKRGAARSSRYPNSGRAPAYAAIHPQTASCAQERPRSGCARRRRYSRATTPATTKDRPTITSIAHVTVTNNCKRRCSGLSRSASCCFEK